MPANLISKKDMKDLAEQAAGRSESKGDPRVKEVTERLLYRLMQVIDECDVSMDEFWAAVGFIAKTAKNASRSYVTITKSLNLRHPHLLRHCVACNEE